MAIPTTGVKLSALQTNLGGSNPVSLSEYYTNGSYTYDLPNVGYGTIPTSGPISMGSFRGQAIYVLRNITSSGPYDLRAWAVSAGWNGTSTITIKIDSSCSFIRGSGSLTINGSWPGGLTVLNYGTIMGQGGSGGSGGGAGSPGYTALIIGGTSVIYFKNYGMIAGGGGGGGSSTIAPQSTIATYGYLYPGGGGGAGGGAGGSGSGARGTYSGGGGGGLGSSGSAGNYATPLWQFPTLASGTNGGGGGAGGGGGGTFYYSTLDNYYASGGGGGGGVIGGSGGTGGNEYYYTSGSGYVLGGSGGGGNSQGGSGFSRGATAGQLRHFAGAGGGGGWGAYGGYAAYGWVPGGIAGVGGGAIYKGGNINFSYTNFGTMYGSVS